MGNSSRRAVLSGIATVAVAGCLSRDDSASEGTATDTPTATATETPAEEPTPTETPTEEPTPTETPAEEPTETPQELFPGYETTPVAVTSAEGEKLGAVTAALAETESEWTVGLSDTESLPEDWGMLFVSDSVSDLTFWMREMSFGIDIIFVDDEKTITGIHHAPEPGPDEDGRDQRYSGRGQYVLEVSYRWTEQRGVSEGDVLEFEL